jgi:hypothetical protein
MCVSSSVGHANTDCPPTRSNRAPSGPASRTSPSNPGRARCPRHSTREHAPRRGARCCYARVAQARPADARRLLIVHYRGDRGPLGTGRCSSVEIEAVHTVLRRSGERSDPRVGARGCVAQSFRPMSPKRIRQATSRWTVLAAITPCGSRTSAFRNIAAPRLPSAVVNEYG